jgi:PKD domain/Kelch motif/Galactose oxidase, central domain
MTIMNVKIKYCFIVLLAGLLFNLSCKKEKSCEGCKENNKPPIAIAGPDQVITLPTDSVSLDGSSSNDPDGTISEWLWTKISGPASFILNNSTASNSVVKNLVNGVYQFELKVTDNGGLFAKDTMQIIVNDPLQPNRPPVANAGADQTITLPANTVNLNGSASIDPDNNITTYLWSMIVGPSSFNIANANTVQTQVVNLVQGIYQFELKVTDAGGLFSKDTLQVTVMAQVPPPPVLCDNSNRPLINAQLIPIGTLSKSRTQIAVAAAGTKILFAGGRWTPDCPDCWGSSRVDIYDTVTHQWSTAELSQGRWGIATASTGNKIFFAGGEFGDGAFNSIFSNVDIYDAATNTWSVASLSEPRSYIASAAVGNKVFFAGGWQEETRFVLPTNKIDIYDFSANTWSTGTLSEARGWASGITVGQKIYFAGGLRNGAVPTNRIDIFDNATNTWSTSSLNVPMGVHAAITSSSKIYWAFDCDVEIKNLNAGNSVMTNLFNSSGWAIADGQNAVIKNNKIIFFRHYAIANKFDIYDIATNTWSIGVLPQNFKYEYTSIIAVNNTIYIAGGMEWVDGQGYVRTNQVWKLEF